MIKVLVFWFLCVIVLSVVLGEIEYRKSCKMKSSSHANKDIEKDSCDYKFENIDLYPKFSLQARGSWRLAQDRVFGQESFEEIKNKEYSKKL